MGNKDDGATRLRLSDAQRRDWLRLIRSENVGPRGIMAQTPRRLQQAKPQIKV